MVYSDAEVKIREYSNKAVDELRRKAAQSFQSAVHISDMKARKNHLSEASRYLQEAIKNYPNSSQLETVQRNLNIINKNLEVLNLHD
jgi:hypothetical protein